MGLPLEQLETESLALPTRERAQLAYRLIVRLDDGTADGPGEVERAWEDEIRRRLAGTAELIPAEEVFSELRSLVAGEPPDGALPVVPRARAVDPDPGSEASRRTLHARAAMPLRIAASDLLNALDSHGPELQFFLDLQTGEVIPAPWGAFTSSDPEYAELEAMSEDETRYRVIEPVPSRRGWEWMEDFAEGVADPGARTRLLDAIAGSGAFGRFKRVLLSFPQLRDAWFRFQEERLREYAREWLADEDIDAELTAPINAA